MTCHLLSIFRDEFSAFFDLHHYAGKNDSYLSFWLVFSVSERSIRRHFGSNEIVGEQSEEETNNFGELLKIRTVSVIGRASREDKGMKLRMSVEVQL
ncbi:unnamed protein product [Cylicocyclus nassatus]|uniref:Uncharacterized protein n=1 Tax=Cylicocyclus nassatus TaxID=53992 RepID=A0AA36GZX3_CYLNA|nr:unnamed protein product [Cylicocyclus nassatus]